MSSFCWYFFNIWPFIYWTLNKQSLETWSCVCCYCAYGLFLCFCSLWNISWKRQEIWGGSRTVRCRSQWVNDDYSTLPRFHGYIFLKTLEIFPFRSKRANRSSYASGAWSLAQSKASKPASWMVGTRWIETQLVGLSGRKNWSSLLIYCVTTANQLTMSLLCRIQWQARLRTYIASYSIKAELVRQYFELLKTLWLPLFSSYIISIRRLKYGIFSFWDYANQEKNRSILFPLSNV